MRKKMSNSRLGAMIASSTEPTPRSSRRRWRRRSAVRADGLVAALRDVVALALDDVVDDGADDRRDDDRDGRDDRPLEGRRAELAALGRAHVTDPGPELVPKDADEVQHCAPLPRFGRSLADVDCVIPGYFTDQTVGTPPGRRGRPGTRDR